MHNGDRRWLGVLLCVLLTCLIAPAAALALSTSYKGKTSQGKRVTIKIVRGKVRQKPSEIHWRARCTFNGKATAPISGWTDFGGELKNGGFATSGKYTSYPGGPTKELNTASVRFTVSGNTVTGSFSLRARIYYEGTTPPRLTARCHTGKITFSATS